jgi:phenylpropionate dioxygenase-like ring-hydroxylating dioxygenase large terminal subunit
MNSKPMQDRPAYPRNCWWVAATSAEVGARPLARGLLDRNVVLFRTSRGTAVALEDRCPHRGAPLSRGRVLGEEIACAYHGFRYDGSGRCTHIPTQEHIPSAMAARSFPVAEHGPFVWIWMGDAAKADPARADPAELPQIAWPTDPAAMRFSRYTTKQCDYAALHENFMDLAHVFFLHNMDKDWQGYGGSPRALQAVTTLEETPHALVRTTRQRNAEPLWLDAKALHMEAGQRVNCVDTVWFLPPGCFYHEERCDWVPLGGNKRQTYSFSGVHCTTPISAGSCHWWWLYAYDFGHDLSQEYQARWETVLEEDADLLEAMQRALEQDGEAAPSEVLVQADQAPARLRRMLRDRVDAERALLKSAFP